MANNIILEVDGIQFPTNKEKLMSSSPYFNAMFSGHFKEQEENVIVIKDISPVAMKIIINSLTEESLYIEDDALLPTLQASCMLQFDQIKDYCEQTIVEILSHEFCLNVYFTAVQLDLQILAKKSLCIALIYFKDVTESVEFLKLNIEQLQYYLAHPALHCNNEMDVFEAGMKWWYEHEQQCIHESNEVNVAETEVDPNVDENDYCTQILLEILSCISFKNVDMSDIRLMVTYPGINKHRIVVNVFECILTTLNGENTLNCTDYVRNMTQKLLNNDEREIPHIPCVIGMKKSTSGNVVADNQVNLEQTNIKSYVTYYDNNMESLKPLVPLRHVGNEDGHRLEGYRIQVWKNKFILLGGEYMYGHGNWNLSCWMFDTTKEKWSKLTTLPSVRRHFKCCIVGNEMYVIGGTGQYRVVQYNMDCYNLVKDTWIKGINFPYEIRDVECCEFNNNLFIICSGYKKVETFLYNTEKRAWIQLTILDPNKVYKTRDKNCKSVTLKETNYVPFVHKGNLYINGTYLLGLKLNQVYLEVFYFGYGIAGVDGGYLSLGLCVVGDTVYIFKSQDCAEIYYVTYSSNVLCFSIQDKQCKIIELNNDIILKQDAGCFALFHHTLL